jgi:hypothetical protein
MMLILSIQIAIFYVPEGAISLYLYLYFWQEKDNNGPEMSLVSSLFIAWS